METFGKYSGALSELWDLTREFTTFCLSEASLQKTRRCYACVFMGRSDKLTWQLTVLIYIYLPLGQNHSTDSLLIGKRAPNLSGMCAKYNGSVTLNASAIKNIMRCLKGTRGYHVQIQHWFNRGSQIGSAYIEFTEYLRMFALGGGGGGTGVLWYLIFRGVISDIWIFFG